MSKNNNKIDLTSLEGFSLEPKWEVLSNQVDKKTGLKFKQKQKRGTKSSGFNMGRIQKNYNKYNEKQQITISVKPRIELINIIKEKIKATGVSYSIKEICDTLCEKKNRLCIQIELKNDEDLFIINRSTEMCYLSQKDAVDDIIYKYGKNYIYSKVAAEYEFKKALKYALQCKTTKRLFPPPSFHYFENIVKNHLFENAINKEYTSYVNGLERIDDQETIDVLMKTKIQTFEYKIIAKKDKTYNSIESLRTDMLRDFNKNLFTTRKKITVNYSDLNTLPVLLKKDIDRYLYDKKLWAKQLYVNCLIHFKKSKYIIYKKHKFTFVCNSKVRNCESSSLNEKSELILKTISDLKSSQLPIKTLISKIELSPLTTTELLKELRWLVKEGFVREFSDSSICLA